ncbi:MAG: sodium-dependent transporter [Paludibacteraceae bacterium]|nr:sodium-dependent transporter [Paludibacteraceae bacterium]
MEKEKFTSRFGAIMATASGAVGLGNIWKFPYMLGQNGGGAFLLVYIVCVICFGLPLMITEFVMGKSSGQSVRGAYQTLAGNNRWNFVPILTCLTVMFITGFYLVITGWCVKYFWISIVDGAWLQSMGGNIVCSLVAALISMGVLWMGVNKGIERLSKIFMPILLVLLVVLIVCVLLLDGAGKGLSFLFAFDASKITSRTVLNALGQCFYSLSIGMGALITFGSYIPKKQNVASTAAEIVGIDTLVAIMAGCAIFPAVFAFGISPEQGPQLVFSVLPAIFGQMPGGQIVSVLFYFLLCIAAITSAVSLLEVLVASLMDLTEKRPRPISRHKGLIYAGAACLLISVLCTLSLSADNKWLILGGKTLFDWVDIITSNFLLPIIALGTVVFFGWFVDKKVMHEEMAPYYGKQKWTMNVYYFLIRWCFPGLILLIALNSIGLL